MTMTFQAIYTGGVLKPMLPLALAEGDTVEITIVSIAASGPVVPAHGVQTQTQGTASTFDTDFEKAAETVFDQHEELLRRLA